MRISELSRRSGVPIPTIKYYIREGLLPPGARTSPNQARYGREHLERLELVRSLREVADLSVATIRETLDAIDEAAGGDGEVPALAIALRGLRGPARGDGGGEAREVLGRVDALLAGLGWKVPEQAPGRHDLASAVAAIDRYWPGGVSPATLAAYARIAEDLARLEIPETWDPRRDVAEALRYAVLGTLLFEPVILALRRLAHIDRSRRLAARNERGSPVAPARASVDDRPGPDEKGHGDRDA